MWQRRSFIASGAALAAGGVFASIGAGEETTDKNREPVDEPRGWSSHRGNAANSGSVATDNAPEPDELVWEYEATGEFAAVDGTVYLRTDGGEIHAIDAQDGSLEWKHEDPTAQGTPAVADGMVYVAGEQLTAFDGGDGEILWEVDLDSGEAVASPTVVSETVYVIADGTLYAIAVADGSITWKRDSLTVDVHRRGPDGGQTLTEERPFHPTPVAVANETVYARTVAYSNEEYEDDDWEFVGIGAVDATTGDEFWTTNLSRELNGSLKETYPVVSGEQVYFASGGGYPSYDGSADGFDLESGDRLEGESPAIPVTSGNEFGVTGSLHGIAVFDLQREEPIWIRRNPARIERPPFLKPVLVGDTLVVYNNDWAQEEYSGKTLLGFGLEDGDVKWSLSIDGLDTHSAICADENTIYINTSEGLLAYRSSPEDNDGDDESTEGEETDEEEDSEEDDEETDEDEPSEEEREGSSEDDEETTEGEEESDEETEEGESDPDGTEERDEPNESDGADNSGIDDEDEPAGEPTDEGDGSDTVPGFTTGAGIAGGALALEWLRRRASVDETEN
ncbi:PQQ-binding-like beta-propeller repeat protein [Natronococcus wangiae]|uniref:PQQ-binding-like beta-propeller repeat protein n=1 Tax=Natronococcus wangiae TaxID=3068275 RepID=UPI00273D08C2|nr:PQQ-binding-like beta-propeller repeat protein [Natronococcus sp. AD5]